MHFENKYVFILLLTFHLQSWSIGLKCWSNAKNVIFLCLLRPCIPNFYPNIRVEFRVGTSFRESERVRKKLEKLVPTLIFGKRPFPKLVPTLIFGKFRKKFGIFEFCSQKWPFLVQFRLKMDSKLPNFLPNFFRKNYRVSVKARIFVSSRNFGISVFPKLAKTKISAKTA
jgi:hypothetical protein